MNWFKKLFITEEKPQCNHIIGDGDSKEVYFWKGKQSQPFKHYVQFNCSLCGMQVRHWQEDSQWYPDNIKEF